MSRQNEAKSAQGYRTTPKVCGNCFYYDSVEVDHWTEKNKRCTLGNFATRKMATCEKWKRKEEAV